MRAKVAGPWSTRVGARKAGGGEWGGRGVRGGPGAPGQGGGGRGPGVGPAAGGPGLGAAGQGAQQQVPAGGPGPGGRGPRGGVSSGGWKLADEPACREDVTRVCPKHSWANNLAVLECLQDVREVGAGRGAEGGRREGPGERHGQGEGERGVGGKGAGARGVAVAQQSCLASWQQVRAPGSGTEACFARHVLWRVQHAGCPGARRKREQWGACRPGGGSASRRAGRASAPAGVRALVVVLLAGRGMWFLEGCTLPSDLMLRP
uniref:Uncharacterized protein n=1 Tax=Terrapene triunguis TaxID=2587831 RepID=A0A674K081_9SAUR